METFNPFNAGFRDTPYPVYAHYRDTDPVHWGVSPAPEFPGSWYIFAYEDVLAILKDKRFRNERPEIWQAGMADSHRPYFEALSNWLLFRDPPVHTRHRRLLSEAFSRRSVEAYSGTICTIADSFADTLSQSAQPDLLTDFIGGYPLAVIARILGVEVSDTPRMLQHTATLARALDFRSDAAVYSRAAETILELEELLIPQIEARRSKPAEDLLSYLVEANRNGLFSDRELVYMVMLLLVAGYETTIGQLGNSFVALMNNRDQWEMIGAEPARMENAVEELTRFDCALQMMPRITREDIRIRDKLIRAGDDVTLIFGSANRDPGVFEDPDRLDIRRTNASKNLTFGFGIHYCIGAQLAKLEIRTALQTLISRFPDIRLDPKRPLEWRQTIALHSPASLPVCL